MQRRSERHSRLRAPARDVTPEQFATARWVFAIFSANRRRLAGTVAALVYYARSRVAGAAKVARARRAYYARMRKPLKVEVPVPGPERIIYEGKEPPVVVEKEVVRWVDQIVLIPRCGIRNLILVNSLIRRSERSSGKGCKFSAGVITRAKLRSGRLRSFKVGDSSINVR
jgi:hypothetical protein